MSDKSYKGSEATKSGSEHTNKSHRERHMGHENGGIKGSKKGIKNSFAGRHLHETEHHERMGHELSNDRTLPSNEGEGPTGM